MQPRRPGFSLMEVMAAIFVLSVAVLALIGVLILNLRATAKPMERQAASLLASSALDRAEAQLREDWTYSPDFGPMEAPQDKRFTITLSSSVTNQYLKSLRVVVTWSDDNGDQRLQLDTAVETAP